MTNNKIEKIMVAVVLIVLNIIVFTEMTLMFGFNMTILFGLGVNGILTMINVVNNLIEEDA